MVGGLEVTMSLANGESGDDVRIFALASADLAVHAGDLLELQHAAYAVEATLIGDDRIPPLHESLDDLLTAPLTWLVALRAGEVVGALAYALEGETIDLDRLIVAPSVHRQGIGRLLMRAALALAPRAVVATGRDNVPAKALYESLGFRHIKDVEVIAGLWVSHFERP